MGFDEDRRPSVRRTIAALEWGDLHGGYIDSLDAVSQLPWATFLDDGGRADAVQAAHARHLDVLRRCYSSLLDGVLPPPERYATAAVRCDHLIDLPLALVAAAWDPPRHRAAGLPLDLHPRLVAREGRQIVHRVGPWPSPSPSELCILVGDDFGESGLLAATLPGEADRGPRAVGADLAAAVRWALDRQRALAHARRLGAAVEALTVDSLLSAIEGRYGAYIQIVTATSAADDGSPLLCCRDGAVDLRALLSHMARARADGFRSPLRAVDVVSCDSAEELSDVFHTAGVLFVSSLPSLLHPGSVSSTLRRLYELGILDGHHPFQHAWIWSYLLDR